MSISRNASWLIFLLLPLAASRTATAQPSVKIDEICYVKGQEPVTLHGFGIVTGLRGTGDGKSPLTLRKFARILEMTGTPVGKDSSGDYLSAELQDTKNVALVAVTVEIPAQGAQQGQRLDCQVTAIAAKSLDGGTLYVASLKGPPGDNRVYAVANGNLSIPNAALPTYATVPKGCELIEAFEHPFFENGKIALVIKQQFATFQIVDDVVSEINRYYDPNSSVSSSQRGIAEAKGPTRIDIRVPEEYKDDVVRFISDILEQRVILRTIPARVRVNERTGSVVATNDARIGPVTVTHNNLTVEAGQQLVAEFVEVDSERERDSTASVNGLVQALRALKVPPKDVISILREINQTGRLYAIWDEAQ